MSPSPEWNISATDPPDDGWEGPAETHSDNSPGRVAGYPQESTLHSDIGEFITQLSNQDAPFLKANAYVRFGDLIVAVRDAWGDCGEYYELSF